ncbi:MAG TPA: HAD family hydrolase [Phycisphaerae bacterium]|nr:HAD family hydrolase [Phycisphaerae bacterium]
MPYRLLAFDHDETLAMDGRIHPAAVDALAAARDAGWLLALVTGRTHARILEICPCINLFDLVVDENGAVLHRPAAGTVEDLAAAPDGQLRSELARRGVPFTPGRVITITHRAYEGEVRDVVAGNGLGLDLYCNRFAVMIVPRGTSKATGLRAALERLSVLPEETIALGDDENDLALFEAAGLRVAVGNAIDPIKAAADVVLDRPNGEGVAAFLRDRVVAAPESLPPPRRA